MSPRDLVVLGRRGFDRRLAGRNRRAGGMEHGSSEACKDESERCRGRQGLLTLLARWDSLPKAIPRDEIRIGLAGLTLDQNALLECLCFNERAYQRNLIHSTETYEVLIICWRSRQRSPIHDHGESTCGVLVVEGVATETIFMVNPGNRLIEARSRRIEKGSIVVSRGGDIHQLANMESPGVDLISLHVYSPRLKGARYYRLEGTENSYHTHLVAPVPETIVAPLHARSAVNRVVLDPQAGG
jgi:cysteine dioxygenase